MRTLFVVLLPPRLDFLPCVSQVPKPGRVQTFVPEAPVEALHMPVLDGFSGLNMNHGDAPLFAPLLEYRLVNSGPLSHRMAPGAPRCAITRSSTRVTCRLEMPVFTSMASDSFV